MESHLLSSQGEGPGTFCCQPARRSQFHTEPRGGDGNGCLMEHSESGQNRPLCFLLQPFLRRNRVRNQGTTTPRVGVGVS